MGHTLLFDKGQVLLIAGFNDEKYHESCLIFNLLNRKISEFSKLIQTRRFPGSFIIKDEVWVFGGKNIENDLVNSIEKHDIRGLKLP